MKNKFKTLLLLSGAVFMAATVSANAVIFDNQNVISALADEPAHKTFDTLETEWFTLKADAYEGDDTHPAKSELEFYLSPVFMDYQNADGESIKKLMSKDTGLIGAIKYILATQVKFIQPVEIGEIRETENIPSTYDVQNRNEIFEQFVKAALCLNKNGEVVDEEAFEEEYGYFWDIMNSSKEAVQEQIRSGVAPSGGSFLRSILSYLVGRKLNDENATEEEIETVLGRDVDGNYETNSALYHALEYVYKAEGLSQGEYTSYVQRDIENIYQDALDIANNEKPESLALAEAFILLQGTTIPVKTVVEILGVETIKQAIIDCFIRDDGSITPESVRYMLETFTADTIYNLCLEIGFTKQEISDAIRTMSNERLMNISKDLSESAFDNIRIILGMANDNKDQGTKHKVSRAAQENEHYVFPGGEQYKDFGNDLVEIVLGRMNITDMINAVEAVWVRNVDETDESNHLLYSYNYEDPNTDSIADDGRRLYLRNLLDWMSTDLPTMAEIAARGDNEHKQTYHFEVKTPLNEDNVWVDLTIGFQDNKDTNPISDLAKIIDDAFDLEYEFVEGENSDYSKNALNFKLTAKPQFLTNAYEYLYNSGFISNTEDNRLKEKLFKLTYMNFGDMRDYINELRAEDMIEDLKNLDYEDVLNTLLHINNLKEIFKNTPVTQEDILRFIKNLRAFATLGDRLSYESIYNVVKDNLGQGIADKLSQDEFKDLLQDINNWTHEMKDNNLSFETLEAIINEFEYQYVDLLYEKLDTVKRFKKVIYRIVDAIPSEFEDMSIMDFYNEATNSFVFDQSFKLDWKKILLILPLGSEIERVLNEVLIKTQDQIQYLNPDVVVYPNGNLNAASAHVYKVTYNYNDGEKDVKLVGMLPEGAVLTEFAPNVIDGEIIKNWKRIDAGHEGEDILLMPNENIELGPVFLNTLDFTNAVWDYDGNPLPNTGDVQFVELLESSLPEGFGEIYEIKYTNNYHYEGGTYVAIAEIVLKEGYEDTVIVGYPDVLVWTILDKSETWRYDFKSQEEDLSGDALTYVHVNDGVMNDITLHSVESADAFSEDEIDLTQCFVQNCEVHNSYELSFEFNDEPYVLFGYEGVISALIPEDIRGEDFVIVTVDALGNLVYLTSDDYVIENNYVKFDVTNIEKYAFVVKSEAKHETDAGMIILLIVTGLFNLASVGYLLLKMSGKEIKFKIKVSTRQEFEEKIITDENGNQKRVRVTKTIKKTVKSE